MNPLEEAEKHLYKKILDKRFDLGDLSIARALGVTLLLVVIPYLLRAGFNSEIFLLLGISGILLTADYVWFKNRHLLKARFILERYIYYPLINRTRLKIPEKTALQNLLSEYTLPNGENFFHDIEFKMPMLYRDEENDKIKRKPYVLIKVKPRNFLPWIDGLYYAFAKDLTAIGFIPLIYVYDFPYEVERQDKIDGNYSIDKIIVNTGPTVQTFIKSNLALTKRYILSISGANSQIKLGSSFFKSYKKAHEFHHFLYGKAFPSFINALNSHYKQLNLQNTDALYRSNKELFYKLIGYPTMLVAETISLKRPILIIQWEGRSDKLIAEDNDGIKIPALQTKTLLKANGRPIEVSNSYHLTDTAEILENKLKFKYEEYGGDIVLKYACHLLLYRKDKSRLTWNNFVNMESDGKKIIEVVNRMKDFLPIKQADNISAYHQFTFLPTEDIAALRLKAKALEGADECYLKYKFYTGILEFQKEFGLLK